jgi:CRISPR/Cas system CSM-associated protein Csm4 (group 5 of RAMP superfamily)
MSLDAVMKKISEEIELKIAKNFPLQKYLNSKFGQEGRKEFVKNAQKMITKEAKKYTYKGLSPNQAIDQAIRDWEKTIVAEADQNDKRDFSMLRRFPEPR